MDISDWLMITAIIIGPIAAVQVQKFIEKGSGLKNRRMAIFKTLMATRGDILSRNHVEALNRIDLEFTERKVLEAWKSYFNNLERVWETDSQRDVIVNARLDLLVDLLYEMGNSLGYKFDRVLIRRNIYSPRGHWIIEEENRLIRAKLIDILSGAENLSIDVASVATVPGAAEKQTLLQELLIEHYARENNEKRNLLTKGQLNNVKES